MYAHYFKSGNTHRLVISESISPVHYEMGKHDIKFNSKKEVNAYMKANPTLIAWNF